MFKSNTIRSEQGFVAILSLILAGCVTSSQPPAPPQPVAGALPVVAVPNFGPVILENGQCSEAVSFDLNALRARQTDESLQGLNECELVALKGVPLSVQTGSSSNSKRETTMLYMEPNGKAVYLFADNKLNRVIRAGQ
jgi:hypothetical protein